MSADRYSMNDSIRYLSSPNIDLPFSSSVDSRKRMPNKKRKGEDDEEREEMNRCVCTVALLHSTVSLHDSSIEQRKAGSMRCFL